MLLEMWRDCLWCWYWVITGKIHPDAQAEIERQKIEWERELDRQHDYRWKTVLDDRSRH